MIDIDDIKKLLGQTKGVELYDIPTKNEHDFNRMIGFIVRGQKYEIEWWSNIAYLWVGKRDYGNANTSFTKMELVTHLCTCGLAVIIGDKYNDLGVCKSLDAKFTIPIRKNDEPRQ